MMYTLNIYLIIGFLYITEGLDVKLPYCRFQCHDTCEAPVDKYNPNGDVASPGVYYWRDFYGVIPPDAYPVGSSTQFPQTYIGLVFDPYNNGSFATTIYDGLDYVYNANNGNTTKLTKHIQILCTKSPESFQWFISTAERYKNLSAQGYKLVKAFYHENTSSKLVSHYVVKTNNCHVNYVGVVNRFGAELEFALIDGTYQTTDEYLWFMYKRNNDENNLEPKESEPTSKRFFSHHYEYQIRPDSIIPKFFKKISIGSCSLTCTNEDQGKINKIKNNVKLMSSLAYFWQQDGMINKNLSVPAGLDFVQTVSYIGQSLVYKLNFYDVGSYDKSGATINYGSSNIDETKDFHVLGSDSPEDFKWVNTTTADFPKLDRDRLIPGGMFRNGTETYVCRNVDDRFGTYYTGSARVLTTGTYCFAYFGPESTFQVLMFHAEKNN